MSKGDKPVFSVRARQEPDSEYMTTVGAAWKFKQGEGFVVKLRSVLVANMQCNYLITQCATKFDPN